MILLSTTTSIPSAHYGRIANRRCRRVVGGCRRCRGRNDHAEQPEYSSQQRGNDHDLPAAASGSQRNIKYVSIVNTDLTTAISVSVQKFDGSTTSVDVATFDLGPGFGLYYEDARGWYLKYKGADVVIDATARGFIAAGTQTATSGTVFFSNLNNITFGMSNSSVVTALADFNISAGTTSQNLSNLVYANSNGISFGLSGSTITASVQPGAAAGIDGIVAGTQTATSGTVVYSNSNNVSFGMSGSSVVTASAQVNLSAGTTSNNLSAITFRTRTACSLA